MKVTLPGQSGANGANVSLVQDGHYLGRAVLSNGSATIPSTISLTNGNQNGLQIIFEKDGYVSATWTYPLLVAPTVTSVSPAVGAATGGTSVTISGNGFDGATYVDFGGLSAPFNVVNNQTITATAPAGVGTTDVRVGNPNAISPISTADQWGWLPVIDSLSFGYGESGNTIDIIGAGFDGVTSVMFGTTPATSYVVSDNGDSISAVVPPGSGTVAVSVTTTVGPSLDATPGSNSFEYYVT